jgi:hypothetical protein
VLPEKPSLALDCSRGNDISAAEMDQAAAHAPDSSSARSNDLARCARSPGRRFGDCHIAPHGAVGDIYPGILNSGAMTALPFAVMPIRICLTG